VPTADTKHSIVIIKQMTYRGSTRRFSNRYHFEGALPSDAAAWGAFADAIVASEKTVYDSTISIVEAIGNDAGSASSSNPHGDAVFTKTYSLAGTGDFSSDARRSPGDCVGLIRYSTPARTSRNHPVYLFNYYHGVFQLTGNADGISAVQKTAYENFAEDWIDGFICDGSARERCGPRGAVATARRVDPSVRHRDFPA
jgi:hypothetical protein